ncbi:hypothetical protein HN020_01685 [Brevibacillus borstelensis]|uniref:hypothetical protein n=1 Tax=Brevibacillus borstelensis TaxID=45462 RepID=UPI000ABE2B48|nr:hypothetical protein [Brevibacillus borstelensis]NOU53540.1 hypothetical protein [Brevibacillus borstelensis]
MDKPFFFARQSGNRSAEPTILPVRGVYIERKRRGLQAKSPEPPAFGQWRM